MNDTPTSIATCPRDGAPLISTMLFPKAEWYCLDCGARLGMFDAHSADATPELLERLRQYEAEWDEHARPRLRVLRVWFDDCDKCSAHREYHSGHATPGEMEAQADALRWLAQRSGQPVS